jgi:hypothetical protein
MLTAFFKIDCAAWGAYRSTTVSQPVKPSQSVFPMTAGPKPVVPATLEMKTQGLQRQT